MPPFVDNLAVPSRSGWTGGLDPAGRPTEPKNATMPLGVLPFCLARLAVLAGCPPAEAVARVRANYCPSAVETAEQEALVLTLPV